MTVITGNTVIGDILDMNPHSEAILLGVGMHCLGCPASRAETLEEACELHGIDLSGLLLKLNENA